MLIRNLLNEVFDEFGVATVSSTPTPRRSLLSENVERGFESEKSWVAGIAGQVNASLFLGKEIPR